MMASQCNPQCFLLPRNQRPSLQLLALVLTVSWHVSVTETASRIQVRGEVGGNVTIRCPSAKQTKQIKLFYFQKGETFVNGYYPQKNLSQYKTWENTRVDLSDTTVHMYSLNMSHSGDYQCHIVYQDNSIEKTVEVHLSITANYSKPKVTVECKDENHGFNCVATCVSYGGYPGNKMMWNVSGSQTNWHVVHSSEISDPNTMMFNSSSTTNFNCSNGELKVFSCSVGDVTSDRLSVCTPKDPPVTHIPYVIAIICSVVIFIVAVCVSVWKCKKGQRGATSVDVRQERGLTGCEEEVVKLKMREMKRDEEAA